MIQHVRAAARTLWGLATLPPALAHETVHAALARPWTERDADAPDAVPPSSVMVDPVSGRAGAAVEWADDAPPWAIALADLGPLILGATVGISAVLVWLLTGRIISTGSLWLDTVLTVWWVIFTMDSAADRQRPEVGDSDGGASA